MIAYPPQVVNLIDTTVAIVKNLTGDRNKLRACTKEVRAFDMALRKDLDGVRALNIMDEEIIMTNTLVGGYIFKREQLLQKMEYYINNKNMLDEILREFCEFAETMQSKTKTLCEKVKFMAPYASLPVIDGLKDFYSIDFGDSHIEDIEVLELRRTITGVIKGVIPVTVLDAKFNNLYSKQDSLIDRLKTFASDSEMAELKTQMEQQRLILEEFKNYFTDRNRDRLTKAFEELDKNPNCLEKINDLISRKETSDQFMSCFRCGELNALDFQFCRKCGAALVLEKPQEGNS